MGVHMFVQADGQLWVSLHKSDTLLKTAVTTTTNNRVCHCPAAG